MKMRMVAGHAAAGQAASGGGGVTLWTAWVVIAFIVSICCVLGVAFVALAKNTASVSFDSSNSRRLVVDHDVVIVGAGLSGAVLADMYARFRNKRVLVIDHRDHIGGNCYDFVDKETGILMNKYGAHLFHTDKERVWKYVQRFAKWLPYNHRVIARVDDVLVPIPANVNTVKSLVDPSIDNPRKMSRWLSEIRNGSSAGSRTEGLNSEQVAVGRVGRVLYDKLFLEYTRKQWDKEPSDLDGAVLSRIPVSDNWDDRYFPADPHQAQPEGGFTAMFHRMFDHPNISVALNTDYYAIEEQVAAASRSGTSKAKPPLIYFTGPIDQFFQRRGSKLPPLQYRSIRFEPKVHRIRGISNPNFVVNFPQLRYGTFTRQVEYKHMFMQQSSSSVVVTEYSTDKGEPYYPVPSQENKELYQRYKSLAAQVERDEGVHFVGRLAQYKYFDMDDAIDNALDTFARVEGDEHLASMLNAAKPLAGNSAHRMAVHFVVSVEGGITLAGAADSVSWLRRICELPLLAENQVDVKWFVYVSGPGGDGLVNAIRREMEEMGCSSSSSTLRVEAAEKGLSGARAAFGHMFASQFEFGDANVYLRGGKDGVDAEAMHTKVECGLSAVRRVLHARGKTMAGSKGVRDSPEDICILSTADAGKHRKHLPCKDVEHTGSSDALVHFIPLHETRFLTGEVGERGGIERKERAQAVQGVLSAYPGAFPRSGSLAYMPQGGEFIATDASLRRMLQRHRTLLWDTFVCSDGDTRFGGNATKEIALDTLVYSLFVEVA